MKDFSGIIVKAKDDLSNVSKQLEIRNVIDLAIIRHDLYLQGVHAINGVEMDDEEFYETLQTLWDMTTS